MSEYDKTWIQRRTEWQLILMSLPCYVLATIGFILLWITAFVGFLPSEVFEELEIRNSFKGRKRVWSRGMWRYD